MIGMSDRDEQFAPLAERSPMQVDHALFRRDPVNMSARGDDSGAGFNSGTIREIAPDFAVEGRAMIGFPPRETAAPRMKSIWPPIPE